MTIKGAMIKSIRFQIRGTVQGVGFRPWIYRLAQQYHLNGFICNTSQGISMEIEGHLHEVENFIQQIQKDPPSNCVITQFQLTDIMPKGFREFKILSSQDDHQHDALVLPD